MSQLHPKNHMLVIVLLLGVSMFVVLDSTMSIVHASKILDIQVGRNKDNSPRFKERTRAILLNRKQSRAVPNNNTSRFKDSRNIERDFLRKFYNQTGGRTWKRNDGWNTMDTKNETDYCNWYGVECEMSGHYVLALHLANNNLTGSLPTGIVDGLQSLMVFEIAVNGLRGIIPEEYGHTTLTDIDLSYNQFEGVLPVGICDIITCSAHNNPRLKCPKGNCNNNHCVMDVCNCGVYSICNNEVDCAGKLCSKCVPSSFSPYIKVCR